MTVPATTRRAGPFLGNGTSTAFPFDFRVFSAADVQVTLADENGVETVQVVTTDYTISINADQDADPGGEVTMLTAPADDETLVITGAVDYDQTLDLPSGGNFSPRALENALDRTVIQIQQLDERLDRSLTLPATAAGAETELPAPEANKLIGWNSSATALTNLDAFSLASGIAYADWTTERFSGTGVATSFALAGSPGSVHNCDVSISGVTQVGGVDFTLDGETLIFTSAPPAGTNNIAVRYGQALPAGTVPTATTNWRVDTLEGDGTTDEFTLTAAPFSANYTQVVVDGFVLTPALDYAISGTTLTFTVAPPASTDGEANIMVRYGREVTDSADASGISYTAPSGVSRMVSERLAERVSVVDYGADPSGVLDSATAIQLAIDTVYASGGGEVWVPAGAYKTSEVLYLKRGVTLVGPLQAYGVGPLYQSNAEGRLQAAIIKPDANVTDACVKWDFADLPADARPYGAALSNLILDCEDQGGGDGIYIGKTNAGEGPFNSGTVFNRNWMQNVAVLNAPRYGVFCDSDPTFRVNFAVDNLRVGFSGSHGIYCYKAYDVTLAHCFSFANDGDNLYMDGCATERVLHCDFFNGRANAATLDGFNGTYVMCSFDNSDEHGLVIKKSTTTIGDKRYHFIGCNFGTASRSANATYDNVHVLDGSAQITWTACKLGGAATSEPNKVRYQAYMDVAPTQACVSMVGTIVSTNDSAAAPHFNDTFWSSCNFSGCIGPDGQGITAKATTLTPWLGSGSPNILKGAGYFKTANVGAATLVGFSAGTTYTVGREVWVLIDDANTAIDFTGTNLKGNGGADIAAGTSQGKLLHFKCLDGTTWNAAIYG